MDRWDIDSHKLMYHPDRVAKWCDKGTTTPIYAEVGLVRGCNHRCSFCAFSSSMGSDHHYIYTDVMCKFLADAGKMGLRSIMYGGDGEPLLHPDITNIVNKTYDVGIDLGITTNGSILPLEIVPKCKWIKVSIDAGTPGTYARIHRVRPDTFNEVMDNIEAAVDLGSDCVIGTQMLLLPENKYEVLRLIDRVAAAGVDYLVIKPYSRRLSTVDNKYYDLIYDDDFIRSLSRLVAECTTDDFDVIIRKEAFWGTTITRDYDECRALPFWFLMDSDGYVYPCTVYYGNRDMSYGNIHDTSISNLLRSSTVLSRVQQDNMKYCNVACRMDQINKYLNRLDNPHPHENFI